MVVLEGGKARVFPRNGHDWSDRCPSIVGAASNLCCKSAIIDGEAIVQDEYGRSDFESLQSAMKTRPHSIILYAFDLLHLDGKDLRQHTLVQRREKLKALVGDSTESRIQFSDEFEGNGAAILKACFSEGLEGIVSKHALSTYRSGRSKFWQKTKCFTESIFVVVGTDRDPKTRAPRALLAHNGNSGLSYAGAAFIALAGDERARFFSELDRLAVSWSEFKASRNDDVTWCQPKMAVTVKHLAGGKMLRHATVRALVG